MQVFLQTVSHTKLVLRKTGQLIPYRLLKFHDFIFQLFGFMPNLRCVMSVPYILHPLDTTPLHLSVILIFTSLLNL